ncbi:ATP-binding protein, partial [Ruminococcaceae bacterium OttesenSCG-928-D13]|nr:ATP-binding protein [Ruminococcaceae bacterium OttesenSCG-928-D13]
RDRAAQHEALALAENRLGMLRAHYRELDAQVDTMRGLHHDFRQQLVLVRSLAEQQDWPRLQSFLDDYSQGASPGGQMVYCENETVNIITRYYAAACREAGIRFEAKYHLPAQLSWPDATLNVVLGNLLENAVAACQGMAGEDRFIRVTGSQKGGKGVFIVENSFEGTLRPRGAVFASTKPGGGQGLRSVQTAARQAGGSAIFTAAEGRFTAMVVLGG